MFSYDFFVDMWDNPPPDPETVMLRLMVVQTVIQVITYLQQF